MRSDTPRTDAQLIKSPYIGRNVCADFARQLERELSALRERLEISDEHGYDGIACRDETIKQQDGIIDALRAQLAGLKAQVEVAGLLERIDNVVFADEHSCDSALKRETMSTLESLAAQLAERDATIAALKGEASVLADILRDAYQVIKTIEGENSDEEERLWQLRYMVEMALAPYRKTKDKT